MESAVISGREYPLERKGGRLAEFYIRSGSRENCFCVTDPKYKMAPPPPLEKWEQAGLDDSAYQ